MYLVERYWPGVTRGALRDAIARLDEAIDGVGDAGGPVRHVESTMIPADDTVFSLFEATSAESVLEVNRRAHVAADRISSCMWFPAAHAAADGVEGRPSPSERAGTSAV